MDNPFLEHKLNINRRHFLGKLSLGIGSVALGSLLMPDLLGGATQTGPEFPLGFPRAGIHNDHETVAEAVRRVAYMINVPHAFTPEYPADERNSLPCKVPVIMTLYDSYMSGSSAFDLAIDVEETFESMADMSWCHQSQIREWLPWVGRHNMEPPADRAEWGQFLRRRFDEVNREFGWAPGRAIQLLTVTAWGEVPTYETLANDLPSGILPDHSNLDALKERLSTWCGL